MNAAHRQGGFSLIEVLVTILVLVLGLLGMAGLMTRASVTEMESYQRAQALTLLKEMEARLRANAAVFDAGFRSSHAASAAPTVFGTGSTVNCGGTPAGALAELCEWSRTLQGLSEREASAEGTARGAMAGARGCVVALETPREGALGEFFIVVVWQGFNDSGEAAAGMLARQCAADVDFGSGRRRSASLRVLIPKLVG